MSVFRHIWSPLLHWAPAPVQVGIALVIGLLLITKVLPSLINVVGAGLRAVWTPMLELLTYPEFLITSELRRSGHQPLPGTYAYGRLLGALQPVGPRFGGWLASRWSARRPRFPWKSALLVIALLVGCWYAAPKVQATGPRTVLANINTDDTHISTWIATGNWVADPTAACTAAASTPPGDANLEVQITGPKTAAHNSKFTITISVHNAGPAAARTIATDVTVPSGLTVIAADGAHRHGSTRIWRISSLAATKTRTYTITLRADASHANATIRENTTSATKDPNSTDNHASLTIRLH